MRYGDRVLFDGLDWLVAPGDRIGLVGDNGTGKTTLLKIIDGSERLESGLIQRQKRIQTGYLPQEGLTFSWKTVFDECVSVFTEAVQLEAELEELAHRMGEVDPEGEEFQTVLDRYEWCTSRYQALDGYSKEAQVGTVLAGLAFPRADWDRPCEHFSGGWQMRVALAKLLLAKPNILLLDEPTNHLDLEARNWFEDYLKGYPHAFVIVSHDRFFLDATIQKVVHLWNRKAHFYTGNYSKFERLKDERLEQIRKAYKAQRDRIEQLEVFINRFRYKATKARQVQSRIKELERMDRIEIPREVKTIHFRFPQPVQSGRVVVELDRVAKSYGETHVFEEVSLRIERGDRIALVGANGAGKSTLIRILADTEPINSGRRREGYRVGIDHFAQDQYKELDPGAIVLDDLLAHGPLMAESELRGLLGSFLFSGDDVFKPIGVLSGGERNRYALARLLLRPSNLLLLDEPTNHLDMRAKHVLLTALLAFEGTIVFVSHDRYFIDRLANKVIHVGNGEAEVYPGGYEDFLWYRQHGTASRPAAKRTKSKTKKSAAKVRKPRRLRRRRTLGPAGIRSIRGRINTIEREIEEIEESSAKLQEALQMAGSDRQGRERTLKKLEASQQKMQRREREWAELSEMLASQG